MTVKRYGLSGISTNVELGKGGLKLKNNGSQVELRSNNELSLVELLAKDGTTAQSVVTKAQLDQKQGNLTIEAGSQNYLGLVGDVLSVKNLLIHDVVVDNTYSDLASYIAGSGYTGTQLQSGDILVLTASSDAQKRSYIHNGGIAGTEADFTRLQVDLSANVIRSMFSAGTGISYNVATGEISVDATAAEITVDDTGFTVVTGLNVQSVFASIDSALSSLDGRVDALETSMSEITIGNIVHGIKVPFDFQSGATFNLGDVVGSGRYIKDVKVKTIDTFNDVAATLAIGVSGDDNKFMATSHNDLTNSGVYSVELLEVLAIDTQIVATMNVGTATQGSGVIYIEYV